MTYRTILAVIQSEAEAPALIDSAIRLCKQREAHLIGFHSEPVQFAYAAAVGFPDAEYIRDSTEAGIARTNRIAQLFGERTTQSEMSSAWRSAEGRTPIHTLGELALAHSVDLIVTAQPDPKSTDYDSGDVDSLLYEAGRPVLVLPRNKACPSEFRRILIGWNGSKQSARAVFDALPFLMDADSVELIVVGHSGHVAEIGHTITDTLKRHGVAVNLAEERTDNLSVHEALANRVAATNADMLVLGAYGHSWLREFLFGGVTRDVLKSCTVATFLSH